MATLHDSFGQSSEAQDPVQLSDRCHGTDDSPVERSELNLCYELLCEVVTIRQMYREMPLDFNSTFQNAVLGGCRFSCNRSSWYCLSAAAQDWALFTQKIIALLVSTLVSGPLSLPVFLERTLWTNCIIHTQTLIVLQ